MKKLMTKSGSILSYGLMGLLIFYILCQIGLIPLHFAVILTRSMTPTINVGDLAIIKIDKHPTLKNGDIIFFRSGNSYAVHRVFNIDQDKITTKGDSNNGPDPEIIKNVNGVFLFKIPLIGYPINILQIVLTYPIRLIRGG